MIKLVEIEEFLKLLPHYPCLDARSEKEFSKGHVPGALNLPLLNNEERILVGTTYKQKGKQEAVLLGFDLVGKRFGDIARMAFKMVSERVVLVYCWRGGMRSNILAWVLNLSGFKVYLLKGGYKRFRNYLLECFKQTYSLQILGGKTGSGKTQILNYLSTEGCTVIDLEKLAQHSGSAYGQLPYSTVQPGIEQFENELGILLIANADKTIWLENESRLIGKVKIPDALFGQMSRAPLIELLVPYNKRITYILEEYGKFEKTLLVQRTMKLEKRLGNLRMRQAVEAILDNRMEDWVKLVLEYYDKTYQYGLDSRPPELIKYVECGQLSFKEIAQKLKSERYGNKINGVQ